MLGARWVYGIGSHVVRLDGLVFLEKLDTSWHELVDVAKVKQILEDGGNMSPYCKDNFYNVSSKFTLL